jgi:hypothetical protein
MGRHRKELIHQILGHYSRSIGLILRKSKSSHFINALHSVVLHTRAAFTRGFGPFEWF